MINPYEPPRLGDLTQRTQGDGVRLIQSYFLYRVIEFEHPFAGRLRYTGWWWRQRVDLNGQKVWFRISWLKIHRVILFRLPSSLTDEQAYGKIDIQFSTGLVIKRFRFTINDEVVYEETN